MGMTALQVRIRKTLALVLPLVLVATGVALPVLDRDLSRDGPVLEAEHHSTCPVAHDHTLCSHAGAARWLPSPTGALPRSSRVELPTVAPGRRAPGVPLRGRPCHPRAPPLA